MKCSAAVAQIFAVGMVMALAYSATAQQTYPSKPIRFISPYAPGGGNDILARLIGQKLTERLGQQVIVENRPGANTIIGTEALAKSPPDGYAIVLISSGHVITPSLFTTPYDAIKDFAAVATVASSEQLLVLHPSVPANNLREFIALAKSRPGQLNYSSAGSGGVNHLAGELFDILTGVKTQHVPYKGQGPALADLVGGQVQMSFGPTNSAIPYIRSGKLKAIAISGETRSSSLPQVPTFAEAGLAGFDIKFWYGVLAPAGTAKGAIDRLSAEIAKIMVLPDIREKLASLGTDPFISTPEQFGALMKADLAKYAKVIRTAKIKIDQ